jgi:hypothetical protein
MSIEDTSNRCFIVLSVSSDIFRNATRWAAFVDGTLALEQMAKINGQRRAERRSPQTKFDELAAAPESAKAQENSS